jgi:hypothetical protein
VAARGWAIGRRLTVSIEVGIGLTHRDIEVTKDHKRKPRKAPKPLSLFDPAG